MTPNGSSDTSPARDKSGDEGKEGPVREKLEETRIDEQKRQSLELNVEAMKDIPASTDGRGRLRKKRSLDDLEEGEESSDTKHTRKRSRDLDDKQRPAKKEKADIDVAQDHSTNLQAAQAPASPVEDFKTDEYTAEPSATSTASTTNVKEPESKEEAVRPSTPPQDTAKTGFANASAKSPFASLGGSKSPFSGASQGLEAFAPSGFSTFAKSYASPFSTLSPSKPATTTPSSTKQETTQARDVAPEKLSFASASNAPSAFGALGGQKPSVFGGALGSTSPFASAPSSSMTSSFKSFASNINGKPVNGLSGAKPTKLGDGAADDDEDAEDDGDDEPTEQVGTQSEEKRDERFYEQDVETGEEREDNLFARRAKLYYMPADQWKERGVGIFKVNCRHVPVVDNAAKQKEADSGGEEDLEANGSTKTKIQARLLFRTEGNLRTMLNSQVTKDVTFRDRPGSEGGKNKIFTGYIDGKPTPCLIQVSTYCRD